MNEAARIEGLRNERVVASPQYTERGFRNPTGLGPGLIGSPLPLLGEYFFGGAERTPRAPLPLSRPHETWTRPAETGLRATWLGHSTVLLELDGRRVLTDPVFGERASPFSFAGPRRFHPTPASIDELPPLDAVVLSHDHYDHLCDMSVRALAKRGVPFVTALGVGAHLLRLGVPATQVIELDWGEAVDLPGLRLTATPSQHFSGRGLTDRNATLWASFVIQSERHKVFFSGDTGLTKQFEEVGRRYGPFDLVMLEVGAFHPSWRGIHLGPDNAIEAFRMLGGGTLLPVHWGTFQLALHAWDEPAETLLARAEREALRVLTPSIGAAIEPTRVERATPWWRQLT